MKVVMIDGGTTAYARTWAGHYDEILVSIKRRGKTCVARLTRALPLPSPAVNAVEESWIAPAILPPIQTI